MIAFVEDHRAEYGGRADSHRSASGKPGAVQGAGKPHARICEGESRMAELLDCDLNGG